VDNLSNSNLDALEGIEKILGYKPDFFETDLREVHYVKSIGVKTSIRNGEIYK